MARDGEQWLISRVRQYGPVRQRFIESSAGLAANV